MPDIFDVRYLGQDLPNNQIVLSGVSFGYVDNPPVWFEVKVPDVESPLRISFSVCRDKSKPEFHFDIGKIQGNQLSLTFFNPSETGASGLTHPLGLLVLEGVVLGFMFHIDKLSGADSFRLSFEFYHGKLGAAKPQGAA